LGCLPRQRSGLPPRGGDHRSLGESEHVTPARPGQRSARPLTNGERPPFGRVLSTLRLMHAETLLHLRRARDLMDHRYAERLDLDALANTAGFSRYHFARSFRAVFGETPQTYLTRRRVERAKDLLRSANLTVTEVCYLVGFSSLGSFSARFSALVGMSPSAYRRQAHLDGPPPVPGCFVMAWARPDVPQPGARLGQERNLGEAAAHERS
jgi:AraC-like DNA-binding protein